MINKKPDVSAALSAIIDADRVSFHFPETFAKLPCISFYEANNSPFRNADDNEYLSEVNIVVDIWAKRSEETSRLMLAVDTAMRGIGFRREFSADVPGGSEVEHKTSRYRYIGG